MHICKYNICHQKLDDIIHIIFPDVCMREYRRVLLSIQVVYLIVHVYL